MYDPHDDSWLLSEVVRKYAYGEVLDVGTGTGIQAENALKSRKVKSVVASDIDPEAIAFCKLKGFKCIVSDLFENIKDRFDTIIFNPPYLPQERKERHIDLEGGAKGHETIERFLSTASSRLKPDGQILLLFSSFTPRVDEIIAKHLFEKREVAQKKVFFETLFVYQIQKSALLRKFELFSVSNISYLAHGKRGIVYKGFYEGKACAIKVKREESTAINSIVNEQKMLKLVNKKGIGPKLFLGAEDFFVYEFVPGEYLRDWIETAEKKIVISVLRQLLDQCYIMDKLGVSKEEMLRPLKNAIVNEGKVVLIDFERTHKTRESKNVTQFCQYLRIIALRKVISINIKTLLQLVRKYKNTYSKASLNKIKGLLK